MQCSGLGRPSGGRGLVNGLGQGREQAARASGVRAGGAVVLWKRSSYVAAPGCLLI